MQQFTYTITDPIGLHARPAGLLVKAAKALDSKIMIEKKAVKPLLPQNLWLLWALVLNKVTL